MPFHVVFLFGICFIQGPPGVPGPPGPVGPKVRILELLQKVYRSFGILKWFIYSFQCMMVIILLRVSDICSGLRGGQGRLH